MDMLIPCAANLFKLEEPVLAAHLVRGMIGSGCSRDLLPSMTAHGIMKLIVSLLEQAEDDEGQLMGDILSEVLGDASMSDIDRRALMRRIVGLPPPLLTVYAPVLESAGLFVVRQRDAALAVGERQHARWGSW
jgi:hypothetical protein